MAKKKTSAKKVTRKTWKATAPKSPAKPKAPEETKPQPSPAKAAAPAAPEKSKAGPAPTAPAVRAKPKPKQKSSVGSWDGKDKGYPDPHHVAREDKTATDRIFVMKKDPYIWDIYKKRKIIIPLG